MSNIKSLKNNIYRRTLIALISVMFCVLLGGYWLHIHKTDEKLEDWTKPVNELTQELLTASGSSDSLLRSSIASYEEMISGLDMTPSVSNALHQYMSNLYTVAGAFENAKAALPQTNNWEYLFNRGTISLLETATYMSGDILRLYSGRQAITDAVRYLSGAVISTSDEDNIRMSKHNLSVALASEIGLEVNICIQSYTTLADSRKHIDFLFSGLRASYTKQLATVNRLNENSMNAELKQCIDSYRTELIKNIADTSAKTPLLKKLSAIAAAKKNTYSAAPLQCPSNIDVYADIVAVRTYEADTTALLLQNSMLENMFLTGNLQALQDACESKDSQQGSGATNLSNLLSELTGEQKPMPTTTLGSGSSNSGSYQPLPDDTQELINDIYQKNIQYIQTMQETKQNTNYRPLQRLQELFKEFNGDTQQFIK